MNAILQAAKVGVSLQGADLYCTMTPCVNCAMAIIRVGIKKVYCLKKYHKGEKSLEMFDRAGIEIYHRSEELMTYENQVAIA
jgi:dCMP deaminase